MVAGWKTFLVSLMLAIFGALETFEGVLAGELIWPAKGDRGFGYDPMFVPNGYTQSFGEMDPDKKHAMSHRSIAFQKLLSTCFQK